MAEELIIYGIGPFAKLMHYYFSTDTKFKVVAFCAEKEYISSEKFCDLLLHPFEQIEGLCPPERYKMFVAIGYKKMRNRKFMFEKAKQKGYELVNYVSSSAITHKNLVLGENNAILANVNIEPFVRIGNHNIFWSDTLLGHDLCVGNYNYISAKCLLAGQCIIGDSCFIGNGASMINGLTIKDETQIYPGSLLTKDTESACKYFGIPARRCGTHPEEGIVIEKG